MVASGSIDDAPPPPPAPAAGIADPSTPLPDDVAAGSGGILMGKLSAYPPLVTVCVCGGGGVKSLKCVSSQMMGELSAYPPLVTVLRVWKV